MPAVEAWTEIVKVLFAATGSFCFVCASVLFGQTPTINRVVDAASFSTQLAPGSLANVIGANFGSSASIPVNVGGKVCAVLSVSAAQLQIQIAVDALLGPTTIQVGASAPFNISLTQFAPVLYSADGTGQGNVQAYHGSGAPVSLSSPASPNEVILIFAIGLGPTTPVVPTGAVPPSTPLVRTTAAPTVSVAGKPAPVAFSGLAPGQVGVHQINFIMRADATTGNQTISLTIGGAASNKLTLPDTTAPVISQLQNNYSYVPPGLPSYGIAEGAIFIIQGRNLANTSTPLVTNILYLPR